MDYTGEHITAFDRIMLLIASTIQFIADKVASATSSILTGPCSSCSSQEKVVVMKAQPNASCQPCALAMLLLAELLGASAETPG